MNMEWFKFYGKDFLTDPKIHRLNPIQQLMWVKLMCYASNDDGNVRYLTEEELGNACKIDGFSEDLYEMTKGFYDKVESMGMIEMVDNNHIRLINYEKRQNRLFTAAEKQQRYRDKKNSNDSNQPPVTNVTLEKSREEKSRIYSKGFEDFWNDYPKKKEKLAGSKAWEKLTNSEKENATKALPIHKQQEDWKKENGQYIQNAATWLNGKRWEDELTEIPKYKKIKPTP